MISSADNTPPTGSPVASFTSSPRRTSMTGHRRTSTGGSHRSTPSSSPSPSAPATPETVPRISSHMSINSGDSGFTVGTPQSVRKSTSSSSLPNTPSIARKNSTVSIASTVAEPIESTRFAAFSGHQHYRPDANTNYYAPPPPPKTGQKPRRICAVVYPFFNEEKNELERSLQAMFQQAHDLDAVGMDVHAVAVMDGWWKASKSMKQYMKEMFPANEGEVPWWERIESIPEKSDLCETYVLQRVDEDGHTLPVDIGYGSQMNLTVIIKRDNRRKHNSHEWFFMSYAPAINAEYAFATDCGTLYGDKCLFHLVKHMDRHEDVAAATGRQRVMSAAMQGTENEGWLAMWYRCGQAYDYEASISSFQGAFSLVGMLPVLPGPCGLYRMAHVKGECLEYYFNTVNINPDETDMVTGNLLLAEDRILSYAAALITGKYTVWVPHAVFYFEAETDSMRFIAQRRRWTNGSFAGYLYLIITHPGLLLNAPHTWYFKVMIAFLLGLQLLMFLLVSIAPAIFISMAFQSVKAIINTGDSVQYAIQYSVLVFYVCLYLAFTYKHSKEKFVPHLYYIALFTNAFMLGLILTAIIISAFTGDWKVVGVVAAVMLTPFLLSFLHSMESFVMMLSTFFPFMFFLPTFVPWFAAYSFSRTWDLTWGNRPSDQMDSVSKEKKQKTLDDLHAKGQKINYSIMAINTIIGVGLSQITNANVLLGISASIAIPSLIQQALSILFYLFYTPHHTSNILWKVCERSIPRAVGILASFLAFVSLCVSLADSDWVTRGGFVPGLTQRVNYRAFYGLIRNCMELPAGIPKNGVPGAYEVNEGMYCGTYNTDLWNRWPTKVWSVCVILLVSSAMFTGISFVSMVAAAFMKDKSRNDAAASLYMMISTFFILVSVFLFPAGLGLAKLDRTDGAIYFQFINENPLCQGSGAFSAGECTVGTGYWLMLLSGFFSLIGAICYQRMRLNHLSEIALEEKNKSEAKKRGATLREAMMVAKLGRLEGMLCAERMAREAIMENYEAESTVNLC